MMIAALLPSPSISEIPMTDTPASPELSLGEIADMACAQACESIIFRQSHALLVIVVGPTGDFQVRAAQSLGYDMSYNETVGVLTRAAHAYATKFSEAPPAAGAAPQSSESSTAPGSHSAPPSPGEK